MQVFAGERFQYNPMENCIAGAYFGRSHNGWSNTELFYGWLANHFSMFTTRWSQFTCRHTFCAENGIFLYCLPPHLSHLLQPLDVGFFRSLKSAWGKECNTFKAETFGSTVTKHTFSEIFRGAWMATVRISLLVNAFRVSPWSLPFELKSH